MSEPNDLFDDESFKAVVIIQQLRIYDVLISILMNENPEQARELLKMHEAGETLCPQPALKAEDLGTE